MGCGVEGVACIGRWRWRWQGAVVRCDVCGHVLWVGGCGVVGGFDGNSACSIAFRRVLFLGAVKGSAASHWQMGDDSCTER